MRDVKTALRDGRIALTLWMGVLLAAAPARAAEIPDGATARYLAIGPGEKSKRLVTDFRLTKLGTVDHEGEIYTDWQMDAAFENDNSLSVRAVSAHAPMTEPTGCGRFLRYRLRLPDGEVREYRHARTGLAELPAVAFREILLPTPDAQPIFIDGFAGGGRYLGQVLLLEDVRRDYTVEPVEDGRVIQLQPDLLIGTARSFRDDGTGRHPEPTSNYSFVDYVKEDFDQLIAAGTNYFGVKPKQKKLIIDRDVYYRGPIKFPEDFYRSNHLPDPMFLDEPMIRLGWQEVAPPEMDHPLQMASFLKSRVEHLYQTRSAINALLNHLAVYGAYPKVNRMDFLMAPCWETEYQTAFYQMAAGAPGLVHEGRYVEQGMGWDPDLLFGPGLEMSTKEMLLCYYAFMRGAARAFDGDWGMSIYGQSDPAMREEALTLAYDMGARYLWFWTSDHDHHMEFPLQVKLAQVVKDHAAARPPRDMAVLRRAAKVGVVFPAGYTLSWDRMWQIQSFAHENPNRTGTTYREVVAAAMWEGVRCAKRGIAFDFTHDHENLPHLGYERLIRIHEDASVTLEPGHIDADPRALKVSLKVDEDAAPLVAGKEEADPRGEPVTAFAVNTGGIRVDGQLNEWKSADWIVQKGVPSAYDDTGWDGPEDFTARIAFAWGADHLYVAAKIDDDRHAQPLYGWDAWKGDSFQIGIDALNENNKLGFNDRQHEIGFFRTDDGRSVAWRWHGQWGQVHREMPSVRVVTQRDAHAGVTTYEAAIPWSEITPMTPRTTPTVGIGVIFNDADAGLRETFHESSPESQSLGKNPVWFRKLTLASPQESGDGADDAAISADANASVLFGRMVVPRGKPWTVDVMTAAESTQEVRVQAHLEALSPNRTLPATSQVMLPAAPNVQTTRVNVTADVPPGRYRLTMTVTSPQGKVIASNSRVVFVYPADEY